MRLFDRAGSQSRRLALTSAIVAGAMGGVAAAPALVHGQESRLFQNSWFWGAHVGTTHVSTGVGSAINAGTLGGEWMITRSRGGLYVSYDQANFSRTGQIADATANNGERAVSIHDMRTISLAGVAFPAQFGNFRPYGGIGFSLSVLGRATAQPDLVTSTTPSSDVMQQTDDAKSRAGVFAIGGGQWQHNRTALFAQITSTPSNGDFLITGPVTTLSIGVRYNFGSSIDK